jgi:hypothetical protein
MQSLFDPFFFRIRYGLSSLKGVEDAWKQAGGFSPVGRQSLCNPAPSKGFSSIPMRWLTLIESAALQPKTVKYY